MSAIEFNRDYGYSPPAPFWLVYAEEGPRVSRVVQTEPSKDAAEAAAARLALAFPGHEFHTLCVMSTISTSPQIVGQRFDPNRKPPPENEPEFDEVEAPTPTAVCAPPVAAAADDDADLPI